MQPRSYRLAVSVARQWLLPPPAPVAPTGRGMKPSPRMTFSTSVRKLFPVFGLVAETAAVLQRNPLADTKLPMKTNKIFI